MAAFTIYYGYDQRKGAIIPAPEDGAPDISVTKNFMNDGYCSSTWNNFPRYLTGRQYHNPYRAIKKFCTYMAEPEWNKFLKELTEYTLGKERLDAACIGYNILTIRLRLLQLVEACRLLDVRINIKNEEFPTCEKKGNEKAVANQEGFFETLLF